jgi:outer membrane protein assembly factor BamB
VSTVAMLATSAPPGPWVSVVVEPSVVCEGDEVRVTWTGHRGDTDQPPERGVLYAVPSTAFVPPIEPIEVAVPGALDVVAVRSAGVAAGPTAYGGTQGVSALVHARPCDAAGIQYRHDVARDVVALAAAPNGDDVVAALDGYGGYDILVRLDALAHEVETTLVTGDRDGRVGDVAIGPDGSVVAVGWRTSPVGGSATEAVVWRWPVGGAPDAGTVVGPTAPGIFAEARAVALDANGRTWVAWTEGPPGHTVAIVAGYAPDGTLVATRTVAPEGLAEAHDLILDALGRPTLVVMVAASAGGIRSAVVHAFDVDGAPRWELGPFRSNTAAVAPAAPGTTLLLVEDALHAIDDTTGATLWTTELPEGRTATHLTVDDAGAPVVAGRGPFLTRYAPDGTPANGRTFGSARLDVVGALTWSGGAVVGGAAQGPLATTLDPGGLREAFVLRFPDGAP